MCNIFGKAQAQRNEKFGNMDLDGADSSAEDLDPRACLCILFVLIPLHTLTIRSQDFEYQILVTVPIQFYTLMSSAFFCCWFAQGFSAVILYAFFFVVVSSA